MITNEHNTKQLRSKGLSLTLRSFYCSDNLCFSLTDNESSYFGVKDSLSVTSFEQDLQIMKLELLNLNK